MSDTAVLLERFHRIDRQPSNAARMLEVLDDDARFHDRSPVVDEERKTRERPACLELLHRARIFRAKRSVLERHLVFVEGDEHLLRVRRERMGVERE
jgi:hypothetical protein